MYLPLDHLRRKFIKMVQNQKLIIEKNLDTQISSMPVTKRRREKNKGKKTKIKGTRIARIRKRHPRKRRSWVVLEARKISFYRKM